MLFPLLHDAPWMSSPRRSNQTLTAMKNVVAEQCALRDAGTGDAVHAMYCRDAAHDVMTLLRGDENIPSEDSTLPPPNAHGIVTAAARAVSRPDLLTERVIRCMSDDGLAAMKQLQADIALPLMWAARAASTEPSSKVSTAFYDYLVATPAVQWAWDMPQLLGAISDQPVVSRMRRSAAPHDRRMHGMARRTR